MTGRDDRLPGILTDRDADLALDALREGRDPGDDLRVLTTFAEDVRVATGGPAPAPSHELALLMLGVARPRSNPRHPGTGRRRTRSWAARTAARVAGLGLAAKATLGGTVAVAGLASAGAAGLLPAAVVDRVRPVVDVVTPFLDLDIGRAPDDERDHGGEGRPAEHESDPLPDVAGGVPASIPVTTGPATSLERPSSGGPSDASARPSPPSSSAPADGASDDAAAASDPAGSTPPPAPAGHAPARPPGEAGHAPARPPGEAGHAPTDGGQTPNPPQGPPPGSAPAAAGQRPGEPGGPEAGRPPTPPEPPAQPGPSDQPGPSGQPGPPGPPGRPPGDGPRDGGGPDGRVGRGETTPP